MSCFYFVPLRSFFLCCPGEALEGPLLTGVCKELNNVDSNGDMQILKITILCIYIYKDMVFLLQASVYITFLRGCGGG